MYPLFHALPHEDPKNHIEVPFQKDRIVLIQKNAHITVVETHSIEKLRRGLSQLVKTS